MSALGAILFRAASIWQSLAGNTSATKKFLTQTGTGAVSAAPGWNTIVAGDLPNTAVTPGSYTSTNLTVDAQGRLTAAANGTVGDFSGPGSSVNNDFVMFSGTTGKLGKDNGTSLTLSVGTPGVDTLIPTEKAVRSAITAGGFGNVSTGVTLTSGKTIIGAGSTNIDVSTLTANVAKSSSGTLSAAAAGTDYVAPGAVTTSGLTQTTGKLLGRSTAATGAIEEITVGTGLTLSAGSLTASGTGGTVTTTGSPTSGNLTKFTGATSISNADLTGDVTTSGTVATTLANTAVTPATYGDSTHVGQFTVDSKGRLTAASNIAITGGVGNSGFVLLEQHTASSSATLDFTTFISSSYDTYEFQLVNVLPATSTADFWIQFGTGAGPTWDTGSNYGWAYSQTSQIPNSAVLGSDTGPVRTHIKVANSLANTSTAGVSGKMFLYDPQSTSSHKNITITIANLDSAGNFINAQTAGRYISTTTVTGIRFIMSTGNIASGTIRVYGLTK